MLKYGCSGAIVVNSMHYGNECHLVIPFFMWLWETIKFHVWLTFVACLLFPLDGDALEFEAVDKAWLWREAAVHSNSNPVITSFVNTGKRFHLHDPQLSQMGNGEEASILQHLEEVQCDWGWCGCFRGLLSSRSSTNVPSYLLGLVREKPCCQHCHNQCQLQTQPVRGS